MKTNEIKWSDEECAQIEHHLEHVLASSVFASAENLQVLLNYLVEETLAGRGKRLNQTSIAIDALGRDERFDPTTIRDWRARKDKSGHWIEHLQRAGY